jgi:long-chain acyl-CoA synthetase
MRASVLDTLDDFERWGKDDCAYVFPRGYRHERWSYRRVAAVAYQFARELKARDIGEGDAVLLWSPNCAEWVAAFLGCALCGVIAVPVDDASSANFAVRISQQVRTRLVLCPRERGSVFSGSGTGNIATIDPSELSDVVAKHPAHRFRPVQIQPSDTLEIVFTSGTTAEPKGVVLTHANVAGNIAPIEAEITKYMRYERLVHPIRFLNLLPLSHVFGQFLGIFLPPLLGGTVVFENTLNPSEVVATIRSERVSVLVAVPRMIDSLKNKLEANARDDFGSRYKKAQSQHFLRRWWTFRDIHRQLGWKFWAIISGGAALNRETEEFWHRLGYAVVQGYGLTETTSLISLNHPFHASRGSIGKVLPGREMKLADDGEILVRGSGVASGYWKRGKLQPVAGPEDEGWYGTGDLGSLDAQGNLFFKGRKKEVIVTPAGMNIYPEDLEAALRQQKEVRDCVVVGLLDDSNGNEEPCAVLILDDRDDSASVPSIPSIIKRANEKLSEYQRIRKWFVWPDEDFPRSATQKPRRNAIRDAVDASLRGRSSTAIRSDLHPFTAGVRNSELSELLARVTGRPARNLTNDADLESALGLSSLERVELLSALEDRYQIDLSETAFANAATVADLEKIIHGRVRDDPETHDDVVAPNLPLQRRPFHYPRWTMHWPATWFRLLAHYLLVRPAVMILGWPHITGCENLRGVRGPLLVVSNHIADVDIGFVQFALPARLRHKLATATRGESLEKFRSPDAERAWPLRIYDRLAWMLGVALLNLFPLPRESGFRKSFAYAGEAVDRGYSVLVFPEGKYTGDGAVGTFQTGIGLLANNLRIPILPVRIDGLFDLKKAGKKIAAPGKIKVRFGSPMQFAPETAPEEIARALQRVVESLEH